MILKRISEKLFGVHRKRKEVSKQKKTALPILQGQRPNSLLSFRALPPPKCQPDTTPKASPDSPTALARLPHPLDRVTYKETLHASNATRSIGGNNRDVQIKFRDSVVVIQIPSHNDYCRSSREKMWSSARETRENKRRNIREFQADQRDWRNCKEDDEMVYLNGELVHPYTYWRTTAKQPRSTRSLRQKMYSQHALYSKVVRRKKMLAFGGPRRRS